MMELLSLTPKMDECTPDNIIHTVSLCVCVCIHIKRIWKNAQTQFLFIKIEFPSFLVHHHRLFSSLSFSLELFLSVTVYLSTLKPFIEEEEFFCLSNSLDLVSYPYYPSCLLHALSNSRDPLCFFLEIFGASSASSSYYFSQQLLQLTWDERQQTVSLSR